MSDPRADWAVEPAAAAFHDETLVWDQHGCLPLRPNPDAIEDLELYGRYGVDFVSINVGFDVTSPLDTMKVLSAFRQGIRTRSDQYLLVATAADIPAAKAAGRLAVSFDLEGTEPLDGELALVETYYDLGVRTMLIAYNLQNRAGGGCHGDPNDGLTDFGRAVVSEMNRVGMLVDATHCSAQTTFELFETSSTPVVFSHSVPLRIKHHDRNVSDEQMRGCAATDGVVGINGLGIFLGENDASTNAIVRAIDYAVEVVGPAHVGIGLDYVFDQDELIVYLEQNRDTFPAGSGYGDYSPHQFVSPAQLPEITQSLLALGYGEEAVRDIMGGNFLRVADQTWR